MTAPDLKELGAVEKVIAEDGFGEEFFEKLKDDIAAVFEEKSKMSTDELVARRYDRFRRIG